MWANACPDRWKTHAVALLLAFAGHAALCLVAWRSSAAGETAASDRGSARVLTVSLIASGAAKMLPAVPFRLSSETSRAMPEASLLPFIQPPSPYYFRLSELTREPAVMDDAVARLVIRMPGLEPQPVVLRMLISDEGQVDQVIVEDSFLDADVEREIREAFAKLRFEPGRIGRIAVRTQMRIEARLETMAYRLPGRTG